MAGADMDDIEERVGDLVARALAGDDEAVETLYRLYERRMIGIAHRRLGHTLHGLMESVDLVQSVWKDALDALDQFEDRGPGSFFAWLHTCLVHKIEAKRRHHVAQKRDTKRLTPLPEDDLLPSRGRGGRDPTPSQEAVTGEDVDRLLAVLNRFSADQRQILVLRMAEGMPYEEIGRRVGKSTEAVKKAYNRGLKRLIEMLPPDWREAAGTAPDDSA